MLNMRMQHPPSLFRTEARSAPVAPGGHGALGRWLSYDRASENYRQPPKLTVKL